VEFLFLPLDGRGNRSPVPALLLSLLLVTFQGVELSATTDRHLSTGLVSLKRVDASVSCFLLLVPLLFAVFSVRAEAREQYFWHRVVQRAAAYRGTEWGARRPGRLLGRDVGRGHVGFLGGERWLHSTFEPDRRMVIEARRRRVARVRIAQPNRVAPPNDTGAVEPYPIRLLDRLTLLLQLNRVDCWHGYRRLLRRLLK